jgi:plasmid stabilization system protein ParE
MPGTHRIILTADALADLQGIAQYIRERSPQNAAGVANTILDAIDSLTAMPRVSRSLAGAGSEEHPFTGWS